MPNHESSPQIIFPEGFDGHWEAELPVKGYIDDVVIELVGGTGYALSFIDPTRLKQELDIEAASGRPFHAVPNLVILPEITKGAIEQVAHRLLVEGFFEKLSPLSESAGALGTREPDRFQPSPSR